jgi:hypothetical protein
MQVDANTHAASKDAKYIEIWVATGVTGQFWDDDSCTLSKVFGVKHE